MFSALDDLVFLPDFNSGSDGTFIALATGRDEPLDPSANLKSFSVDTELALNTVEVRNSQFAVVQRFGRALPIDAVIRELVSLESETSSSSLAAWSLVVKLTLAQIARGEIGPGLDETGQVRWWPNPPSGAIGTLYFGLLSALPLGVHKVTEGPFETELGNFDSPQAIKIQEPTKLLEVARRTIVDAFVRVAGIDLLFPDEPLAKLTPYALDDTRPSIEIKAWVDSISKRLTPMVKIGFRLELMDSHELGEGKSSAIARLIPFATSQRDPSLQVDVADMDSAPATIKKMFNESFPEDVLVAVRRAGKAFPPVAQSLITESISQILLKLEDLDELFKWGIGALDEAGFAVLLPKELLLPPMTYVGRGSRTTPGATQTKGVLSVQSILNVDVRPSIFDQELTDEEIDEIAHAKRSVIRFRDRWLRVNQELVDRLTAYKPTAAEFIASALVGEVDTLGGPVRVLPTEDIASVVEMISLASTSGFEVDEPPGLKATLRHYQRRGLGWLSALCDAGIGGCLADDMGLGKTIQIIALHLAQADKGKGPTLVVCPTSVVANWKKEFERFAPGVDVHRYQGAHRRLDSITATSVIITSYQLMRQDIELLKEIDFGIIVADEAQYIKNHFSKTARAIRQLRSSNRIALTGTPVENRLSDLWAILDFVLPGLFGNWKRFHERVIVPIERRNDQRVAKQLAAQIGPFLLRRKKSDPSVAPELPIKTETEQLVQLTAEQVSLYRAVVEEALGEIRMTEGISRRAMVLSLLTSLKQICNHPAQFQREAGPLSGRSGKLEALLEIVELVADEGEQCLIFTQFVQAGHLIERRLSERGIKAEFFHGGLDAKKRVCMVESFQRGDFPVMILSLKAGGTGINLTAATHVVHFDRWWNPATEDQATDRAYRIGQIKPVQVHKLVSEGSIEEKISMMIARKRRLADSVLGSSQQWITELDDEELTELVSLSDRGSDG